jgi:hypothetical protein
VTTLPTDPTEYSIGSAVGAIDQRHGRSAMRSISGAVGDGRSNAWLAAAVGRLAGSGR